MTLAGKSYWIVGVSEGLGRALAQAMDKAGVRLILSARSGDRLAELAGALRDATPLEMDVSEPAAVARAVGAAGEIDGVIYCAGQYTPLKAQDWDAAAVEAMCEVNFLGAVRLLGHVVPRFAGRNRGHIVLIGSLAGFRGLPGAIGYGASKAALMHLGETIYADLRGGDVKVQLVNPGFIKTRLTDKNDFRMPLIQTPEQAADHVLAAMKGRRFSTSFPVPFSWLFRVGRVLPHGLFYRIFR
ncbi:SDR family NAD(P)-dependent oxidoreductase [Roseovarius spongiae]|uniref:SDR family NAD(P)-dependent oxidoreductase n=1 Tax=Roseovarius spongiae TaxID=2320272 RepID=A0A3A8AYZ5_9RHOB|nr:SDR family NAD(P)-dependent oxidoreductase [Roseovarius spongiae]RKF17126.1 SDR family NAD(P)-dependent oxidoreductase [Roseovarius spongiae]